MALKLWVNPLSQPARSLLIFTKANSIATQEIIVDLVKEEQKTEEYKKVNPFQKVPLIDHDGFRLTESIAILSYLARTFPVPEHWYPKETKIQAKVDAYMAWQQHTIRTYGTLYFFETYVASKNKKPINEKKAETFKTGLKKSLDEISNIWLKDSPYIGGSEDVNVADLLAVTEMEQIGMGGYDVKDHNSNLRDYMERVRARLQPHYDEVHQLVHSIQKKGLKKY